MVETRLSKRSIVENSLVLWLDPTIDESSQAYLNDVVQLRQLVNSVQTFVLLDDCVDYLSNIRNKRAFLIISSDLAEQLVPAIADLSQLAGVYLYSSQTVINTEWTNSYVKVKGTLTEMKDLCQVLKKGLQQVDGDLVTFDVISPTEMVDLNRLDQSFMYSQLLKEVLLEMEYNDQSKEDFAEFCSILYTDNQPALSLIDQLKNEYEPRSAISWYTREFFLYSMLNRALRTQDVQSILRMAFFIRDLHQQIQQLHLTQKNHNSMTMYRGQGMCNAEFEKIRQSKDGLIFFNNFLSTTLDEPMARMRACSAQDDPQLTGVYFQIDIDPSIRSRH